MLSPEIKAKYQPVMGLEIHVQLDTNSKIFAPEGFAFGAEANHFVSPVSMAHPGALPVLNRACLHKAIKMGLATECHIAPFSYFARKNYFYPDLPKGYQLSQDHLPICSEGKLHLRLEKGTKTIAIERIHLEEDAGKSIHDQHPTATQIDLNRAGTGLIEIVSKPDFRTTEEVAAYVTEIRKLVRFLGVGDGDMEKGNLRCDANVSVMPVGSSVYGTRAEIKNINSITQLVKAVEYEIERQIEVIEAGNQVVQQTRLWDGTRTQPMREKETAADYRYFPEPDLLPLQISEAYLAEIRAELPELPQALFTRYTETLGLPANEVLTLLEEKDEADYFAQLLLHTEDVRAALNWILGPIRQLLHEKNLSITAFVGVEKIAEVISLVQNNKISHSVAKEKLLPLLLENPSSSATSLAEKADLLLQELGNELEGAMRSLMEKFPDEVKRYQQGKKNLTAFFVGQLMREMKGKADPKAIQAVVNSCLGE